MINRLTNKKLTNLKDGEYIALSKEEYHKQVHEAPTYDDIYKKLGKLEDLEEELGIDIIQAVELCKQVNSKKVVYTKENWGIGTIKILDELDIELFNHRLYKNTCGMYISLDLKDYNKTWSLTKEKLEDET